MASCGQAWVIKQRGIEMTAERAARISAKGPDRLQWWRDARFGMFIHWGLYAVPAGVWKGKEIEGIGEWIACYGQIPPEEYALLARRFNPYRFDADKWAQIAKDAGMKYVVFTAKHADGFAMYHSKASDFNVVDATPFGRDVVAELAKACRKAGLRFGVYYSQDQDLHEPGAGGYSLQSANAENPEGFADYQRRKVRPQLKELLTEYGPIDLIWFDNPMNTTRKAAEGLKRLVRRFLPRAIINGRIGFELGDYKCLGDNQVSAGGVAGDWETIATMNKTWGYKKTDHDWKSAVEMIRTLVDITSKGGTYLLNVGPTGLGVIPAASVTRLRTIGRWLRTNGEAIYGAARCPFPCDFTWGRMTVKGRRLYLHFFEWPKGPFRLHGVKSRVRRAYLLADGETDLAVSQAHDKGKGLYTLDMDLPRRAPDRHVSVVAVETAGRVEVDGSLQQQPDGEIILPAHAAEMHPADYWGRMRMGQGGCITDWYSPDNWLAWRFKIFEPGEFEVHLLTRAVSLEGWEGAHKVEIAIAGRTISGTLTADTKTSGGDRHYPEFSNRIGAVRIDGPGPVTLTLRSLEINPEARGGLTASCVRLAPAAKARVSARRSRCRGRAT